MFCLRLPAVSVCLVATCLVSQVGLLQGQEIPVRTGTFIRPGGLPATATLRSPDDVADAAVPVPEPVRRVVASSDIISARAPAQKKYAPPVISPVLRARAIREAAERTARLAVRKTAGIHSSSRPSYNLHSTPKGESSACGQADHGISIAGAWRGQPSALRQPIRLKPAALVTKTAAYLKDGGPISHDVPTPPLEPVPALRETPVVSVAPVEVMDLPETEASDEIIDWGTPPPEEVPAFETTEPSEEEPVDPFADE